MTTAEARLAMQFGGKTVPQLWFSRKEVLALLRQVEVEAEAGHAVERLELHHLRERCESLRRLAVEHMSPTLPACSNTCDAKGCCWVTTEVGSRCTVCGETCPF